MRTLIELLKSLAANRFYGEITVKFEAGKIVNVSEYKNHDPKAFTS